MHECIGAVEQGFVRYARGEAVSPGVLGAHVDGGGFHVKTAGFLATAATSRPVFAAKINANFPGNPDRHTLPTIQGVVALFDASDGRVMAVMDSIEITSIRTGAATAVAARFLAPPEAGVVTVCGCGEQARNQLRAVASVRAIRRVMAFDLHHDRAQRFAAEMAGELGVLANAVRALGSDTHDSDIWITCTSAHSWFLGREHVRPGAFIATVGADNPEKQEIEPQLLASSAVVADVLEQAATIGDTHHAIAAGLMRREDVRAELADVVGRAAWRPSEGETVVFDSTGTALEDVAAAELVYRRACASDAGLIVDFSQMTASSAPGERGDDAS